jgi:KaiC/GvpD/RAD55 family RecA-like ATPase
MASWDLDSILEKAKEQEEKYGWLFAAWSYEHALKSNPEDNFFIAETMQQIGFCYRLAARQSENQNEFRKIQLLAIQAYEESAKYFDKIKNKKNKGKREYCIALVNYLKYKLESTYDAKTKSLEVCYASSKIALDQFHNNGHKIYIGMTLNLILECIWEQLRIAPTEEDKHALSQEALEYCSESISVLLKVGDPHELLDTYYLSSLHHWYAANISDREEACDTLAQISIKYAEKALTISKDLKNPYSKANSLFAATLTHLFFTDKIQITLGYAEKMFQQGRIVHDNYFLGVSSYLLALATDDMVPIESNPDEKKKHCETIIQYSEQGIKHLQKINRDEYLSDIYMVYTQSYSTLSKEFSANPIEKLEFSRKAIEIGKKGLEHAKKSFSPDAMGESYHALSKALQYHAMLVYTNLEKRKILQEALENRNQYIKIIETALPSNYWILGLGKIYAAQIKTELAELGTDESDKISLLKEAASFLEEGLIFCEKWITHRSETTLIATTAIFKNFYGKLLEKIHHFLQDETYLRKANAVFEDTAKKFEIINSPNREAETYWRIARNQDLLRDRKLSSKNFSKASKKYEETAQQMPPFSNFFLDYSTYMKAWSEIEKAKEAHDLRQHALAMKYYRKTAEILEQSKGWGFLSSNFLAWAYLESAEFQSRKEKSEKALDSFEKANKLFRESKNSLQIFIGQMENREESHVISKLIEVSELRAAYCFGRIAIEEARVFEKQGNSIAGAEKYGLASETFQNIMRGGSEQIKKELLPIIYLCKAWQKMRIAETKSSPKIYGEAAELFKKVCENAIDQSMGILALAHSNFCKALEAGTDFETSRKIKKYAEAKKYLEIAANNYLKTGFKKAAEYANGTQRLFDAYVYIENAKMELDPEKKTKYYSIAEKVLQYSVRSFSNAKHPERTRQVTQLLEQIKEEKELAVMLTEILQAPAIISSTESFVTPAPSEENPVGLENFEGANIQATVSQTQQAKSKEDFNLELNIVNVGKEPIQISKITEIIPQGFELIKKPEYSLIEDSSINMKNKRLDPMMTEEIILVLRSSNQGSFEIKPEITYINENGNQLLYRTEPATIEISKISELNRVPTGYNELDKLLFGGIPETYPVILTSPFCEERDLLIKRFLKAGIDYGETIIYFTVKQNELLQLAQDSHSKVNIFLFNPFNDKTLKESPNIFKLKGVEKLTDISIALTKALRQQKTPNHKKKRACIEIISDVLLQHDAVKTRRWLTGLINELKNQGFTTLAVMNPLMHSPQDVHAILGLFDGEIALEQRKTARESQKILKINRMFNQKYFLSELVINKEKLIYPLVTTPISTNYISTGSDELDKLLIKGIPKNYPVILTAPFCDEKDLIIKQFLEKGLKEGDTVFYMCTEITGFETEIKEFPTKFYLFICNPQAEMFIKDSTNVFKLKNGVMSLTNINIALSSVLRKIEESTSNSRRICINLVSDVLLQHHAINTKNWLTGLIAELKSQRFTTLAVMNPLMHSPQEVQAILGLFDGEIALEERKTTRGSQKILKINRMYNQKYLLKELQIKKKK